MSCSFRFSKSETEVGRKRDAIHHAEDSRDMLKPKYHCRFIIRATSIPLDSLTTGTSHDLLLCSLSAIWLVFAYSKPEIPVPDILPRCIAHAADYRLEGFKHSNKLECRKAYFTSTERFEVVG
jgi:hypothetical protein